MKAATANEGSSFTRAAIPAMIRVLEEEARKHATELTPDQMAQKMAASCEVLLATVYKTFNFSYPMHLLISEPLHRSIKPGEPGWPFEITYPNLNAEKN
jgi:hypothetical protein